MTLPRRFSPAGAALAFCFSLASSGVARAQAKPADEPAPRDRPSEDEIFGAPEKAAPGEGKPEESRPDDPESPSETEGPVYLDTPEPAGDRDESVLGDPGAAARLSLEAAPEDPLQIGGQIFSQARTVGAEGQSPDDYSFTAPTLVDVYLDSRPNDRLRAFVLGRMQYDPTLPQTATIGARSIAAQESSGATMGVAPLSSLFAPQTSGPHVFLDQLWLRWDIDRRVFVTAGKQHVRWGTARFWTPTDYLHVRRRNPLDVFDARVGTSMLKLHVPWEATGWNFYAFAILENPAGATPRLRNVAGAARAEFVYGPAELGAGAVVRDGDKPRWALDFSSGIWDFDVYGELGLRYGSEIDRVRYVPDAPIPPERMRQPWEDPAEFGLERLQQVVDALYPTYRDPGVKAQLTLGLTYSRKYNDNDLWLLGLEYFENGLGYGSPTAYPGLVLPHTTPLEQSAAFFYLGGRYAALFLSLPAPYSWNYTTISISTIGNLSDNSYISRLDYSVTVLTHLQIQSFVAVRYGSQEGEFRFGVDELNLGGLVFSRAPALLDIGIALRVQI